MEKLGDIAWAFPKSLKDIPGRVMLAAAGTVTRHRADGTGPVTHVVPVTADNNPVWALAEKREFFVVKESEQEIKKAWVRLVEERILRHEKEIRRLETLKDSVESDN